MGDEEDMRYLLNLITSISLVTVLNFILMKKSKEVNRKISWQHYFLGYMFLLYLLISLTLVVGFPSLHEWIRLVKYNQPIFNPNINLIFLRDGFEISTILNIIFLIPFGFLLPSLWGKYDSLRKTIFLALIFSLIIEFGQLFIKFRATDINDLVMNALGGVLGWMIYKVGGKVFNSLSKKTSVINSNKDNIIFKLEPYLYIIIALGCTFFSI